MFFYQPKASEKSGAFVLIGAKVPWLSSYARPYPSTSGRVIRTGVNMGTEKEKKKKASGRDISTVVNFSPEIDLRGQYGDDACFMLDKYIDDAKRSGVKSIRVIHGKGTGALRKAVTDFLRKDKRIASVRLGNWGEGDTGVSIVELK